MIGLTLLEACKDVDGMVTSLYEILKLAIKKYVP